MSSDLRLLEFGAGASTLFFQERVSHLTALESERYWVELLRPQLSANVALITVCDRDADSYVGPVTSGALGLFDVVFVDGKFRNRCMREALKLVSDSGVILLDDSSRETYRESFALMRANGYKALRISGVKPGGVVSDETTIFYRDVNCLEI